jgi:hypothetical protein
VLLACDGTYTGAVLEQLQRLGLDCQLVHNRAALMVLPAGVSKGRGLFVALGALGLSHHNTVAIGDAENDISLLQIAEVGVAVANAVPSLKHHADVVSRFGAGEAVTDLARGPLFTGTQVLCPERHWIRIGEFDDGTPCLLPGSQATILITGESGSGKSYVAGLLVEQWVDAGYIVLVIDPEGDHVGLHEMPGVLRIDVGLHLPDAHEVVELLQHGSTSVVLDLTAMSGPDKILYVQQLRPVIDAVRRAHGLPHWVVADEAHLPADDGGGVLPLPPAGKGSCLITYRPELLPEQLGLGVDITLTPFAPGRDSHQRVKAGRVLFADTLHGSRELKIDRRRTEHVRHLRKYTGQQLPDSRRFFFQGAGLAPAGNLVEFQRALRQLPPEVLTHHAGRHDFSRWIAGVLQDPTLAKNIAEIEYDFVARAATNTERARSALSRAITSRYRVDGEAT